PNSEAQQSNSIPHTENASLGAITSASSKSVYPNSEAQQSNSIPHTENTFLLKDFESKTQSDDQ
ncbi:MAG: hypothetical protein AAF443_08240, partial [Chlamydiota bacterium]